MSTNNSGQNDPIKRSSDMANAEIALKRAALSARELARKNGTAIVTSENGKLKYEYPSQKDAKP